MDAWIYILLALLPVLYIIRCLSRRQRYVYPPGPKGWPLFGNVFDVDVPTMHLTFTEMSKKYGDIVRVKFLGMDIIVLNSNTAIRQALTSDELAEVYAGRPKTFIGTYTIISRATTYMDPSEEWFKRRKVLHKTLKMYGEGVREQEVVMRSELSHVIERLGRNEGPCIMEDIFLPSLVNIMTIMVIGKRFDYDDQRLLNTIEMYRWANKMATVGFDVTMMLLPFLRHFSFGYGRYYQTYQKLLIKCLQHCVEEPKSTYDPAVSRGLVDVLLKAQKEEQKTDGRPWLEDEDIKGMVLDTIGAGILTSQGTLLSFFLAILHKPEVAKRVQEEIDRVVGSSRHPELKDRPEMPYTEACILETLRFISHLPLSLPHCTTRDSRLGDYFLPANTMVLSNLWAVHHDETLWTDPWAFMPERFMDKHGKMLPSEHPNRRNLMAFSLGRRSCVGEGFAKARLFLYITSLLQRFHFKSPNSSESLPPLDPRHLVPALVLSPAQYSAVAVPR